MFKEINDKIKELLTKFGGEKKLSLEELQQELLRAESLRQASEIEEVAKIISELSMEVERIELTLTTQKVRTSEQQFEREHLMAKKDCYLQVLQKFSIPDIEWIKEEIQKYEDK